MTKLLKVLLLCVAILKASDAFDTVDVDKPIKLKPSRDGQLFGHGISLAGRTAIVGAPDSDTTGQLFRCDFQPNSAEQDVPCSPIKGTFHALDFITFKGTCIRFFAGDSRMKRGKNFLGATVVRKGQSVATCGFRENQNSDYFRLRDPMGVCYKYSISQQSNLKLSFSLKNDFNIASDGTFNDRHFSIVSYLGPELLYTNDGLVFNLPNARRIRGAFSGEIGTIATDTKFVARKWWGDTNPVQYVSDMTGNGLVEGKFFSSSSSHYAMGAPKWGGLIGKVYICYQCFFDRRNSRKDLSVTGADAIRNSQHFEKVSD